VRFFAANALTQKIRLFWDTLDTHSQGELKDELLELACRFLDDTIFQLRLSMALAAIAVRTVDTVWYTFWQDMSEVFAKGIQSGDAPGSPTPFSGSSSTRSWFTPSIYAAKLAVLGVLSALPIELEKCVCGAEGSAGAQNALKSGIPVILEIVQEVLKYPCETETTKTTNFGRSGSAPPGVFHSGSPISSSGFSTPTVSRSVPSRRNVGILNTWTLKKSALEALHFWVTSASLSSLCPSTGMTLRTMIHTRSDLLTLLFESVKIPRLTGESGEILLALFTRRSLNEGGGGLTQQQGALSSAFTSASRLAQTSLQTEDSGFVQNVVSQLLGLVDCYRSATQPFMAKEKEHFSLSQLALELEEESKLCKAIVLLFVGFGESNGSLFSDALSVPLLHDFLEILLEMTSHPLLDIAELAMQFWNVLEYHICGNPDFGPLFDQLLRNTLNTCIFPSYGQGLLAVGADDEWEASEECYQFKNVRESAIQTLRSCYSVMGDQFLEVVQNLVDRAGHNGSYDAEQWRNLELAFFAATTVNLHVPANAPLISQLFRIGFSLPVDLSQQTRTQPHKSPNNFGRAEDVEMGVHGVGYGYSPTSSSYTVSADASPRNTNGSNGEKQASAHDLHFPPFLLNSIVRFVGEYRMWIVQAEDPLELLEPALFLCLDWATAPNSDLAFSASISFKELCFSSASHLVPHLSALAERYAAQYSHIRGEDRVTIATGLTAVLRQFESVEEMVNAIQYLWDPTISSIRSLLELTEGDNASLPLESALCTEMEILSAFFSLNTFSGRSLLQASVSCPSQFIEYGTPTSTGVNQSSHPLVVALQAAQNPIFQILDHLTSISHALRSHAIHEQISMLYSILMASCQEAFEPLLEGTLERLLELFLKQARPTCLQAMSTAVNHFGTDANHLLSFSKLILEVSQAVYQAENQENFDLLCSYFELCSAILSSNPDILVQTNGAEVLNSLIRNCIQTTLMGDTTLLIAGLTVLDKLMFGRHVLERESWKQFTTSTVEQLGEIILEHLLKSALNTSHHKTHQILATVLHKLVQTHAPYAKQALAQVLAQESLPGNLTALTTAEERERIVNIFLNLRSSIHFRQFFTDFINVANRRAEISLLNSYDQQYGSSNVFSTNHEELKLSSQHSRLAQSQNQLFAPQNSFTHSRSTPHVI
jgi:hypothetical protein